MTIPAPNPDTRLPPETQLANQMAKFGLNPPSIVLDGHLHRFSTNGKADDDAGWYVGFADNIPSAAYGNWRTGEGGKWHANIGRNLTLMEMRQFSKRQRQMQEIREKENAEKKEAAAETCASVWQSLPPATAEHWYLQAKKVQPHGARVKGETLVLPILSTDGSVQSLQYIYQKDGKTEKRYHKDGAKNEGFFTIGTLDGGPFFVCEGFATGASIHEATGVPVVIAFDSGNLPKVAKAMRERYPGASITIAGDNDTSGTGQKAAELAARESNAQIILPPIEGQDFNDLASSGFDIKTILLPQTNRLKIIRSDDLPDEYTPPDEVVQGLFVGSEVSVLYGASNSGKTFLACEIARSVAMGVDFMGRRVDRGDVLYLATESPHSIKTRIQAINKHFNTKVTGIHIAQAQINLYTNPEWQAEIIEAAKGCRMIVCDTLARMSAGANENSGQDMGPIIEALDAIAKQTGAAVVVVHHSGKDATKGARGWSGLYGAVDAEIEVKEVDGQKSFSVTKQRQLGTKEEEQYFSLEVVAMGVDKWGQESTTCVVLQGASEKVEKKSRNKKLAKQKDEYMRAWIATGKDVDADGRPIVSGPALSKWFENRYGHTPASARKASSRLLIELEENKIISREHGFNVVIDDDFGSLLLLMEEV